MPLPRSCCRDSQTVEQCSIAHSLGHICRVVCQNSSPRMAGARTRPPTEPAVHAQQGSHTPFPKTAHGLKRLPHRGTLGKLPVALKIASAHISPSHHASHVHSSPQPAHIVLSKICSSSQASKKAQAPQDLRRPAARPLLQRRTGSYTQTSDGTRGPAAQAPAHGCTAAAASSQQPVPNSAQAQAAGPNLNSLCRNAHTLCHCSASKATAKLHAAQGHRSSLAAMAAQRRAPARESYLVPALPSLNW